MCELVSKRLMIGTWVLSHCERLVSRYSFLVVWSIEVMQCWECSFLASGVQTNKGRGKRGFSGTQWRGTLALVVGTSWIAVVGSGAKVSEQFDFLLTHVALPPGTVPSLGPLWGPSSHPLWSTSVSLNSDEYGSSLRNLVFFVMVDSANNVWRPVRLQSRWGTSWMKAATPHF